MNQSIMSQLYNLRQNHLRYESELKGYPFDFFADGIILTAAAIGLVINNSGPDVWWWALHTDYPSTQMTQERADIEMMSEMILVKVTLTGFEKQPLGLLEVVEIR